MTEIPIILKFGGAHKRSREIKRYIKKRLYKNQEGLLNGYCDAKAEPPGFKIWVNSRQSDREMVDSFFHEMTHALLRIRFTRKPFHLTEKKAEQLCSWIGYLAKQQFADMMPRVFGRKP